MTEEKSIIDKFNGLSTGWKIVVVLVAAILVGSVIYVVSGEYDKDQAKEQEKVKEEKKKADQREENLKIAMRKCVVMETKDIYSTPSIDQEYTRENAISSANSYCLDYKSVHGEDALLEDTETDWNDRKNEVLLGQPLTYWFDNYANFSDLYRKALEQ